MCVCLHTLTLYTTPPTHTHTHTDPYISEKDKKVVNVLLKEVSSSFIKLSTLKVKVQSGSQGARAGLVFLLTSEPKDLEDLAKQTEKYDNWTMEDYTEMRCVCVWGGEVYVCVCVCVCGVVWGGGVCVCVWGGGGVCVCVGVGVGGVGVCVCVCGGRLFWNFIANTTDLRVQSPLTNFALWHTLSRTRTGKD